VELSSVAPLELPRLPVCPGAYAPGSILAPLRGYKVTQRCPEADAGLYSDPLRGYKAGEVG